MSANTLQKLNSSYKHNELRKMPWEVVRIEEFVEINKESRDPTKEIPNDRFMYIDIESVEGGTGVIKTVKEILGSDAPSRARRIIHQNDVIMSTVRPYLKAFALVPREYNNQICSTGFAVLSCKNEISPRYLLYTLFSKEVIEQCNKMMMGGQYPALNQSQVAKIELPLPHLSEQRRIAEVLGTVDSAIQKVGGAIERTERLKKGLMQRLLTKGIGHERFKESEVGRVPEEWDVKRLGDALELCQYGLSVKMDEIGKYPIIKMDDFVNGVVVPDKVKYIDLDEKTFKNFKLEKGDILFNRTNSYELVGRTGIFLLRGDYVFASYLIRLRPKKETVDSQFLTFYMAFSNDRIRQQLATRAVHQANINATNLQNYNIPLPPLPEQRGIAEILSAVDRKLELERRRKEKLERVKKGLMNELLTGRKRVNI